MHPASFQVQWHHLSSQVSILCHLKSLHCWPSLNWFVACVHNFTQYDFCISGHGSLPDKKRKETSGQQRHLLQVSPCLWGLPCRHPLSRVTAHWLLLLCFLELYSAILHQLKHSTRITCLYFKNFIIYLYMFAVNNDYFYHGELVHVHNKP